MVRRAYCNNNVYFTKKRVDGALDVSKMTSSSCYTPTKVEHVANVVTHGFWILPSIVGFIFLVQLTKGQTDYYTTWVYGVSLVALFTVSTSFHSVFYLGTFQKLKDILHRCDRAVIYLFIAGNYTPWLLVHDLELSQPFKNRLCASVWTFALLGVVYQHFFHERHKTLETLFYFLIAVLPALVIFSRSQSIRARYFELLLGGLIYLIGVFFFKSDGHIPCAHAIWHLCVNMAVSCHYLALYNHFNDCKV